jgi:predicted small integral membrane protein
MTPPSQEDVLVGLVALALVPLIGWRILRGFREGRLPIYRTYLTRGESGSRFGVLMALHILSLIVVGLVAADLLLNLGLRSAL